MIEAVKTGPGGAKLIAVILALATFAWFLFSRLSFAPVPWPDGSAFYLPVLDLLKWPPEWRMHAQAAFVPSYDQANFNLMPGLPLILALGAKVSGLVSALGAPRAIRAVSLVALVAYAYVLWDWARALFARRLPPRAAELSAAAIGLVALWDPTLRWGTLVVRTETWIGLGWVLMLRELSRAQASLWKLALFTSLIAYVHFEAAYFVPAIAVAALSMTRSRTLNRGLKLEAGLAWRTLVFLSPWLLYVLIHWNLFWSQMDIQFHRLHRANYWVSNPYLLFHSLFLWTGSPEGTPKFFNVAQGLTWITIAALTLQLAWLRARAKPLLLATALAFWTCFYLWCTKPEVWFITLCHLTLWPWLVASLAQAAELGQLRAVRAGSWLAAGIAAISLAATAVQNAKIPADYNWSTYDRWVSCIERQFRGKRIWQPHVPDILVELSSRDPGYDLTRALDFGDRRELAERFGATSTDAIVFSRFFNVRPGPPEPDYEGPERAEDRELLTLEAELPFGPWALRSRGPGASLAAFEFRVCHIGPFWADVARR